jgi:hypothetical protein
MITADESTMDVDYPFFSTSSNTEYEYIPRQNTYEKQTEEVRYLDAPPKMFSNIPSNEENMDT